MLKSSLGRLQTLQTTVRPGGWKVVKRLLNVAGSESLENGGTRLT
jgi:hypothetical protein